MSKEFTSPLMSLNEAAAYTTMSKSLVRHMAAEGQFPQARKIGVKRIAFVRADVEAWVASKIGGAA